MTSPVANDTTVQNRPDPRSTDLLLKVLRRDGRPPLAGTDFRWSLPTQADDGTWTPGRWHAVKGRLVPCANGLHLCRVADLPNWIARADELYVAEHAGRLLVHDEYPSQSKVVVRRARLVQRVAFSENILRAWAADCAEHVLHLFEARYPDDKRPRQAIEAARAYVRGEIAFEALQEARSAAYAAYAADAAAAAYAAAYAAYAADAAAAAYAYAADAAAYAYAAYPRQNERTWQVIRLAELLALPGYTSGGQS